MTEEIKKFTKICKLPQDILKKYLVCRLKTAGYKEIIIKDGYIYARGDIPYLLTAHMDTVHKVTCRNYIVEYIGNKTKVWSKDGIGGDDRCGIHMILRIIEDGCKPSVLFCEDEEIGGVGSNKFCKSKYIDELKEMKYLIELDRMNGNDAVFYDCNNEEFTQFIIYNTGYKKSWGSFSDISNLSPACKVASVNLSCGYYNPHTTREYVVMEEMEDTINIVKKLLSISDCKHFDYIESEYIPNYYNYCDCYDCYDYNYNYYNSEDISGIEVEYVDKNNKECIGFGYGKTMNEALLDFFLCYRNVCYDDVLNYDLF